MEPMDIQELIKTAGSLRGSSTFAVSKNHFFKHILNVDVIRNMPYKGFD